MKKAFLITILIGITFLGCSDNFDNNIISTTVEADNFTTSKIILSDTEDLSNPMLERDPRGDRNSDLKDLKKLSVSKLIDGAIGGEIVLDTTYVDNEGRLLNVYARLKFDPGVFNGSVSIDMVPNLVDLSIRFFPHMTFNEKVKLDYIITGLDLEAMGYTQNSHIDFVYYSPNGDIELIANDRSNVHLNQQRISVQGGNLYHFSRYGWIR